MRGQRGGGGWEVIGIVREECIWGGGGVVWDGCRLLIYSLEITTLVGVV